MNRDDTHERLAAIEKELRNLERASFGRAGPHLSKEAKNEHPDTRWCCQKCGATLGWYDEQADQIRWRVRGHHMYARLGGASQGEVAELLTRAAEQVGVDLLPDEATQVVERLMGSITRGYLEVTCQWCGEKARLTYQTPEEVAEAQAQAPRPARRRRVVRPGSSSRGAR